MTSLKLTDGHTIPALAIGTGTALFGRDAQHAVVQALHAGITHLDGAQVYRNEATLGAGITAAGVARDTLFVTTKLNTLEPGQTVRTTLVESLGKLGTEYVDLFLIHSPNQHKGRLVEVWRALEEVKREGLARSVGVSNATVRDLQEILDGGSVVPAINQVCPFTPRLYTRRFTQLHALDRVPSLRGQSRGPPRRVLPEARHRHRVLRRAVAHHARQGRPRHPSAGEDP